MLKRNKVVITSGYRWKYFQWFLLGLYELQEQGSIDFAFKLRLDDRINATILGSILSQCKLNVGKDSYNMCGYFLSAQGKKKKFCIDSADSPFLFDEEALIGCDVYFKMQYPKDIDEEYFSLTDDIKIPWQDHKHIDESVPLMGYGKHRVIEHFEKYTHKIKPLMIGPRRLVKKNSFDSLSFKTLQEGYSSYLKDRSLAKSKRFMCYFGDSKGPVPNEVNIENVDFDKEADLVGAYINRIQHPNEKRAIVADIVSKLDWCDARVINGEKKKGEVIPLDEFCSHISQFQYNMNVSGYRLSIPNRFIESFLVGTGIVTDKLHVKWYKDFDNEVVELVEMGYLLNDKVNWEDYEQQLRQLPPVSPKNIIENYEKKWAPIKVAEYIVETLEKA